MNSADTIGQMPVQCGSINSRTTTLPRKADSGRTRPSWSVRVKPGASRSGTGDSSIKLTWLSVMLAGIPDGRP